MKLWLVFKKSLQELWRDPLVLSLTLVFAPCFMVVYALFFPSGSTTYTILVLDIDQGVTLPDGSAWKASAGALEAINAVSYADGKPMLKARLVSSRAEADQLLRSRSGVALVTFGAGFSADLVSLKQGSKQPVDLVFGGDLTNPYYPIAAILATSAVDGYILQAANVTPPVTYIEEPLGGSGTRTEYEIYVPGLLVFAIIMLVFLASMTVAREIEAGTLKRLQLTRLRAFDLLGGITLALVLVGVLSQGLAYAAALAMGFHSQGPLWAALLVGALTSLAVVGCGMVVACFSRTVSQAFVIANFPLAFFMFFSGVMYPIPKFTVFTIGEQAIGVFDILPTTHAVAALSKIFTFGASAGEVAFELAALALLSAVYFAVGVWLFQRRVLQ